MSIRAFSTQQLESLVAGGGQQAAMASEELHRRLLSGDATWAALKQAVQELSRLAPQDHDVVLAVEDIFVTEARYIEPHTFLFGGFSQDGHRAWVVIHFSQVVLRVVHRPKRGPQRVITGFSKSG